MSCEFKYFKKTKIICTLGPSTDKEDIIRELIENGMDVARFNFSHGTHLEHKKRVEIVRKISKSMNKEIALMLDTRGPEIRIGCFKNGSINLSEDQIFTLTVENILGDEKQVHVTYDKLVEEVDIGKNILVDDGKIALRVIENSKERIVCKVLNSGILSDRKSINIPDIKLKMPYMSENDKKDILFGIENDFDFISASFVRNANDLFILRTFIENNDGAGLEIIAKIENKEGLENIDDIIKLSDFIMVARGDMGVEIPLEKLPGVQKTIIKKCLCSGKGVITATQMLESMIKNPRPTRAETSDVANAVYDGSSAVMLSGETASGLYPTKSVLVMSKIIRETEKDIDYKKRFEFCRNMFSDSNSDISAAISEAAFTTAHNLNAKAIIAVTKSGKIAKTVSAFKPGLMIVATVITKKIQRQMMLYFGVYPIFVEQQKGGQEIYDYVADKAQMNGVVKNGDIVVITGSTIFGTSGTTDTIKVKMIGKVLAFGRCINNKPAFGRAVVLDSSSFYDIDFLPDGDILIISEISNFKESFLRKFKALVVEEIISCPDASVLGTLTDMPIIYAAENATKNIKSGDLIALDNNSGVIYEGH